MFKFLTKLLLLALIALVVLPFIPLGGKPPLLNWSDIKLPTMPSLPNISNSDQVKFYKWQDSSGQWHVSNQPPKQGIQATTVMIDGNANTVPAVTNGNKKTDTPTITNPYNPQNTQKLIQDAQNVQQLINNRQYD